MEPGFKNTTSGFTLVEMLLAIAIIVIVVIVVFVAVDPARRLAESRNAERSIETREIMDALYLYYADYSAMPAGVDSTVKMIGTAGTGCEASCEIETAWLNPDSGGWMDSLALLAKHAFVVPTAFAAPISGVAQASDNPPVIYSAEVSPTKVRPGDTMLIQVEAGDNIAIDSVVADMAGIETVELELVEGDAGNGFWQAEWLVHSTKIMDYTTIVTVTDVDGLTVSAPIQWSDPPVSGWRSPTSYVDSGNQWTNESNIFDGNSTTYGSNNYGGAGFGQFIELNMASTILSDRLRVKADYTDAIIANVDIDVYSGGSWVDVFDGGDEATWNGQFVEVTYAQMNVDAVRFRYNYAAGGYYYWLYELEVYENAALVVPPICGSLYATAIQKNTAVLHEVVDDDGGEPCDVRFNYGKTLGYGTNSAWHYDIASGDLVNQLISGLDTGTTYYYRAELTNSAGTTYCTGQQFTTTVNDVDWLIPTGHNDPSGAWEDEVDAYDDTTSTFARDYHAIGDGLTSEYIYLTQDSLAIDGVRWYARGGDEVNNVEVDVFKDGSWENVYDGPVSDLAWMQTSFTQGIVSQVRFRFTTPYSNRGFYWELFEVGIHKSSATSEGECLDLAVDLSPEYIADMPTDPLDGTPVQTLYAIRQRLGGAVEVIACNAELEESIYTIR